MSRKSLRCALVAALAGFVMAGVASPPAQARKTATHARKAASAVQAKQRKAKQRKAAQLPAAVLTASRSVAGTAQPNPARTSADWYPEVIIYDCDEDTDECGATLECTDHEDDLEGDSCECRVPEDQDQCSVRSAVAPDVEAGVGALLRP